MASFIKMPQLSDTMNAGKILSWRKNEGAKVGRGDILAEVETDKANLEIECFQEGILLKILVPAGESAKVGENICVVGAATDNLSEFLGTAQAQPSVKPAEMPPTSPAPSAPPPQPGPAPSSAPDRVKASPLAKKLAQHGSVDLSGLQGSGPGGRIVRKDVEQALSQPAAAAPRAHPSLQGAPARAENVRPLSKMRETIGRRMQESVTQAPHFYMTKSIIMDQALSLREILKEQQDYKGISVNHMVIKACAYALAMEPRANYSVRDGQVYEPADINIGIITALEEGLIIPVLRQVDRLTLKDVVFEARALVERARAGRPTGQDLSGGTFSISNMGMFDVDSFTAIINPGQGAILAVGSAKDEPIVRGGVVIPAKVMKVTASADHRVMDAVVAAGFLKYLTQALENPALLVM